MDSVRPDMEAVLERFDSVIRETMMQLHRSQGEGKQLEVERADWQAERVELHLRAEEQVAEQARSTSEPLRAALGKAIERIDRILDGTPPVGETTEPEAV
jgi:hypothetical protein